MFGSNKIPTQEEAGRKVADATSGGSGAEQDRYGAHFEGAGDKIRETASNLSSTTQEQAGRAFANKTSGPSGAEQDRLEGHFGGSGGVFDSIKNATGLGKTTPEEAARKVADATSGPSGAEQDRLAGHFQQPGGGVIESIKQATGIGKPAESYPEAAGRKVNEALSGASGAEQDRLGGHFTQQPSGGVLDSIKNATGIGKPAETGPEAAARKISETTSGLVGAEQDRYGSHFGVGNDGLERLKQAAETRGEGAEQDRYAGHFGLEADTLKQAAQGILNAKGEGAEQERHAGHFGLGADGLKRAQAMANTQGVGAEQDRYGAHFGLDKDTISKAAEHVRDGAQQNLEKK